MTEKLNADNSLLLVIDIQEKFRPVIYDIERIIFNSVKLIGAFNVLEIPIIVTEQYPKGLGETVTEIQDVLEVFGDVKKVSFDCFDDAGFVDLIKKEQKRNFIICGIESHVCVFQTAMSAMERGYSVYLVADAVSSRRKSDLEIALKRLEQEGVKLVSAEMIIFQMIKDSKDRRFKEISKIVK